MATKGTDGHQWWISSHW